MTPARVKRACDVRSIISATMGGRGQRTGPGCKDGVVQMHATDHLARSPGSNR